jgi:hypothetical protein
MLEGQGAAETNDEQNNMTINKLAKTLVFK